MDANSLADETLWALWKRIPPHVSTILATDVTLGRPEQSREWTPPNPGYLSYVEVQGSESLEAYVAFDLKTAIAASGVMVMMQESAIKRKMTMLEFEGDDFDAMGECVNQMLSIFNDLFKERIGEQGHLVFARGLIDAEEFPTMGKHVCISGAINIGEFEEGRLDIVLPLELLGVDDDFLSDSGDGGVQLSEEELAALREATKSMGEAKTMFLVPLERERAAWNELLDGVGIEYDYVSDLYTLHQAVKSGECTAVVIDADACPSGGLLALAKLRYHGGLAVPAVVVASRPTRTHVVSCLAAGAALYLRKPISAAGLVEAMGKIAGGPSP